VGAVTALRAVTAVAGDAGPVLRGPIGGPRTGGFPRGAQPRAAGPGAAAAAVYRAVEALRPSGPADRATVEVSVRAAGGGRLTVARQVLAGETVGIEALVG
jgi:hypothetical protein